MRRRRRKRRARGRVEGGEPGTRTHVTPLSVLSSYIRSLCDFLAPPRSHGGLHFALVVISRTYTDDRAMSSLISVFFSC